MEQETRQDTIMDMGNRFDGGETNRRNRDGGIGRPKEYVHASFHSASPNWLRVCETGRRGTSGKSSQTAGQKQCPNKNGDMQELVLLR